MLRYQRGTCDLASIRRLTADTWSANTVWRVSYTSVCTRFITKPWADFPCSLSPLQSTVVGIVSVPKKDRRWNISSRAFGRRIVRYWHPLACRGIELGKIAPVGGGIYTGVCVSFPKPLTLGASIRYGCSRLLLTVHRSSGRCSSLLLMFYR